MGKYKDEHHIIAAASIANPFDFVKAAQGLLNTIYDKYLAQSLQTWAERYLCTLDFVHRVFCRNKHILIKAAERYNIEYGKKIQN